MANRRWMFEHGAAAFRATLPHLPHIATAPPLPSTEDVYLCPLCWQGFDSGQIDLLTREHAPPKALGEVVTLTCGGCNAEASSFLQAHAAGEDKWRRFRTGEDGTAARVTLRDLEARWSVRADMVVNEGAFWTVVDRERSNPDHHRRLSEILGGSREGGGPTRFMLEGQIPFIPSRAEASRLRDAYLAAFALLGYRYILSEELDDVRRRIQEADPVPETIRRAEFLGDLRGVFVLAEPVESVLVVTNGTAVFLPSPGQGADLTEWLAQWDGSRDGLAGVLYEWPTPHAVAPRRSEYAAPAGPAGRPCRCQLSRSPDRPPAPARGTSGTGLRCGLRSHGRRRTRFTVRHALRRPA